MKIRSGFVSNSSSSSFIVGFKKKPKNVEEVKSVLFGTDSGGINWYDHSMSAEDVARRVFSDLKEQKSLTKSQIRDEVKSGYFEGYPDLNWDQDREAAVLNREFGKKWKGANPWAVVNKDNKELQDDWEKVKKAQHKETEEHHKDVEEAVDRYVKSKVYPKLKGLKVFTFTYADDGGEGLLEHGGIFHRIPHVQISHH